MTFLYDCVLAIYRLLIGASSLFNAKARLWIRGRKGLLEKLETAIDSACKTAWFHCASLGEFEQGRPVIEKFREAHPEYKILLTFFSPSGYEVRKDYEGADYVFYLPLDSRRNARRFIKAVNPEFAVFVKYEFWYHYFNTLQKEQVPVYVISANFRVKQHFFAWYGKWFRKILNMSTHIFVQNEFSLSLLNSVGIRNASVSGDTRFDRVHEIAGSAEDIPLIRTFKGNSKVLVAGSTWRDDERLLVRLINESGFDLKYVIVPHEIDEAHIKRLVEELQPDTVRLSEADDESAANAGVLIVDSVGLLSGVYQYGDIAYIGGGFGAGIHNILEPAAYGQAVIFGSNFGKFQEAIELMEKGGAFTIGNYSELLQRVKFLLSDEMILMMASEVSKNYIRMNTGASGRILGQIAINR